MVSRPTSRRKSSPRSSARGNMAKGKRRTDRSSKDENAVLSHLDGPKGPKDSRLEAKVVNGSLTNGKLGHTTSTTQKETKITTYFSPSRSPPAADDAEGPRGETHGGDSCDMNPELSSAQLSRTHPSSAPSTPTKMMNGHAESANLVTAFTTPPKRTVCTRSQALKELQLQTSPTAPNSASVPSSPSQAGATATTPMGPSTPTSPTPASAGEDGSSPHTGPPTPHKIQALNEERLRLDSPLSPSSALSKLKLSLTPKKLTFNGKTTKARKKLPVQSNTTRTATHAKPEKPAKSTTTTKTQANGEAKSNLRSTQMTEYFPIRRSERKPKTTLLQERQKAIEERIISGSEEGLTVKHFGAKGRGVITTRKFAKGEFVVEYIGDLIDMQEAKEREKIYAQDASKGCYNYYFTFQNQQYCIDATEESGYLGRLVNHSRNGNLVPKAVEVNGRPHLILLAKHDLEPSIELLYDYGDRSKEALEHHPWLAS
ncbi:N-lysine methyltransferase KMT5A-A-like [Penaeus indicus]|uniref:N-lysine methyltransferase KMT5A-A-like n=1 Tax=Penaeus indicus TaxID=29960 RepID=UPI00300D1DEB